MVNKSGAIGTATETAIVRHAHKNGFGGADEMTKAQRLRLNGANDQGDIGLCPGVMVEAKGGHAAERASDAQIAAWLDETEAERINRGADVALLVLKRKGKGAASAGQWWAILPGWTYLYLAASAGKAGAFMPAAFPRLYAALPAVRMTFDEALTLLRRAGYGDPL